MKQRDYLQRTRIALPTTAGESGLRASQYWKRAATGTYGDGRASVFSRNQFQFAGGSVGTSALASMRALEVWRLFLRHWFQTAEPAQSVAAQPTGSSPRRSRVDACHVSKTLRGTSGSADACRTKEVRFSEREPSRFQIIPAVADHVPYHGN